MSLLLIINDFLCTIKRKPESFVLFQVPCFDLVTCNFLFLPHIECCIRLTRITIVFKDYRITDSQTKVLSAGDHYYYMSV